MPDFTTHHIFGQQLLETMSAEIRKAAEAEPSAYFWGLQGPDLLFFHRAVWEKSPLPQQGRRLHAEKTGPLFTALLAEMIDRRKMADFPVLEAYFLGFICHYILDREMHPYIFYRQREIEGPNPADSSAHWKIEAAIDRELYHLFYERSIRSFPLSAHYKTGRETRTAISGLYRRLLYQVYGFDAAEKSIAECFKDAIWINRLLYDRSGVLKPVACFAQNLLKKENCSPVISKPAHWMGISSIWRGSPGAIWKHRTKKKTPRCRR